MVKGFLPPETKGSADELSNPLKQQKSPETVVSGLLFQLSFAAVVDFLNLELIYSVLINFIVEL